MRKYVYVEASIRYCTELCPKPPPSLLLIESHEIRPYVPQICGGAGDGGPKASAGRKCDCDDV